MNKILKLAIANTGIQDFFDFKLFVAIDDHRRRGVLDAARDIVDFGRLQEGYMEHGMDAHRRG